MSNDNNYSTCPLFGETTNYCYTMKSGPALLISTRYRDKIIIQLTDDQPKLFIDNIWPGSLVLSDYLQDHSELCCDKDIIELGAGTALPSLTASRLQSRHVVITDYPDDSVIENLRNIVELNNASHCTTVISHQWGANTAEILSKTIGLTKRFQLVLVAEPLWKDTYILHNALLTSISQLLCPMDGTALITFAHRPTSEHTPSHDLELFTRCSDFGLVSTYLGSSKKYRDAQEDNDFIEVHIYSLKFRRPT